MTTRKVELWGMKGGEKQCLISLQIDLFTEELKSLVFCYFGKTGYKDLYLVYP